MRIAVSVERAHRDRGHPRRGAERRGHHTLAHGALAQAERADWAWASEAAARDVAEGRAEQAIVCCWTGTGASIAANKVAGVRAALCPDAATAAGARRWNDANVLALSLRSTSEAELGEILDAWFASEPSAEPDERANVEHLREMELSSPGSGRRRRCSSSTTRPSRSSRSTCPSTSESVRNACVTATLPHSSWAISWAVRGCAAIRRCDLLGAAAVQAEALVDQRRRGRRSAARGRAARATRSIARVFSSEAM